MDVIQGIVSSIRHRDEKSGFTVMMLKPDEGASELKVTGLTKHIGEGDFVEVQGEHVCHPNFGDQIEAKTIIPIVPETGSQIEAFLASGVIPGVGKAIAKKLVKSWGDGLPDLMVRNPLAMSAIRGISEKKAREIAKAWVEYAEDKGAQQGQIMRLNELGFTQSAAEKIMDQLGGDAVQQIEANPYALTDVSGYGFDKADAVANKLGIDKQDKRRLISGVKQVLFNAINTSGHTGIHIQKLRNASTRTLGVRKEEVNEVIDDMLATGNVVLIADHPDYVFHPDLNAIEAEIADNIRRLDNSVMPWSQVRVVEKNLNGFDLTEKQVEAQLVACNTKVSVITGQAGCGKTSVLQAILKCVTRRRNPAIQICAPTGKAAQRASEATGYPAKTIHRLLGVKKGGRGQFKHNRENPLPVDLVVVDEGSIAGSGLMLSLLRAIPDNAVLIILGDPNQLPSVSPGAFLRDLIESGVIPVVELTEVKRTGAESGIYLNARSVLKGEPIEFEYDPSTGRKDFAFIDASSSQEALFRVRSLLGRGLPERGYGYQDVQILTPMKKGLVGTESLNKRIQSLVNKQEEVLTVNGQDFGMGDRVIQTRNAYNLQLFNGDMGIIQRVDVRSRKITVEVSGKLYDLKQSEMNDLELAYGITIHKSQGSEFPVVILPILNEHHPLLQKNLLYTGISRARSLCIVVGQREAVMRAIENNSGAERVTASSIYLKERYGIAA